MLSRAQEARVREILGNGPPGTLPVYCLEHLATTAQIPPAHLADLAAFVRNLGRARDGAAADLGPVEFAPPGSPPCFLITTPDETVAALASALVRARQARSGRRIALSNGAASGSVTPLMDRRAFIGILTCGLLAAPLAVVG
jgi:hypothetical protein